MSPQTLAGVAAVIPGLMLALAGYRIYRFGVRLAGFLLGFLGGVLLGATLARLFELGRAELLAALGAGLVFGLAGSFFMPRAVKLMLFLSGFGLGLILCALVAPEAGPGLSPGSGLGGVFDLVGRPGWKELAVGLLAGLAAMVLERWFVIAFTAVWGALLVDSAAPHPAIAYAVLGVGILWQVFHTGRRRRRRSDPAEEIP